MNRPDVIAFDLGGVLVDVDKTGLRTLGPLAEAAFFDTNRHQRLSTGQVHCDAWVAEVAAVLNCTGASVRRAWSELVSWAPGGLALVRELVDARSTSGLRIWSNIDAIHWGLLEPDIGTLVPQAALSFQLGCAKPDPLFFTRALAGLAPRRVLFLDDRADNVAAACLLGIDACLCQGVVEARSILRQRQLMA